MPRTARRRARRCLLLARQADPRRSPSSSTYRLLSERPYELTSDDLLFEVHAIRQNIEPPERTAQREAFFTKPQACLRSSPLAKRYGWGFHHDGQGRVALVPLGSTRYQELSEDSSLTQLRAMRSRRAS